MPGPRDEGDLRSVQDGDGGITGFTMDHKFFSLSAITSRIQEILQPHIGKSFWLKAEISSGRERGGSFYCDLVETNEAKQVVAQMRCTIWYADLQKIRKEFQDKGIDLLLDDGTLVGFQCCLRRGLVTGLHPARGVGGVQCKSMAGYSGIDNIRLLGTVQIKYCGT